MMLVDEGFSEEIKQGLIFALLSSSRPTHELLAPNIIDQTNAFTNQFEGMSALPFSYQDHEATMLELVEIVNSSLTVADKQFLLSVVRLDPDWSVYNYQDYPSIQWKLFNLDEFKNKI